MGQYSLADAQPVASPAGTGAYRLSDAAPAAKDTAPVEAPKDTTGNIVGDALAGAGAGVIQIPVGIYDLIRKIPGVAEHLPEPSPFVRSLTHTPDTVAGKAGRFLEGAAEFAVPGAIAADATKGMGLISRAAGQAVAGGTVAAVDSGGSPAATAAGAVLGGAGPVAGEVAGAAASKLAPALYQSALKPTWAMAKKQGMQMIDTGLGLKIPVSAEGAAALDTHIQNLRDAINQGIDQRTAAGRTVDSTKVVEALDGLKDWAKNTLDPQPKLEAIQKLEDNFIAAHGQTIPLDKAQQLKINTYGEIKNSYGEMSNVETEAKKQLARGLKEQISAVFPEVAGLNDQQSKALGLDEALTRAVWRIDNKDMLGIGLPLAASAGHAALGGPGLTAAMVGKILLDNPAIKSRLAIVLGKKGVSNATGIVSSRIGDLLKEGATTALSDHAPQPVIRPAVSAPISSPPPQAVPVPQASLPPTPAISPQGAANALHAAKLEQEANALAARTA